jgi:nitrous oxidase accessory protein NosD
MAADRHVYPGQSIASAINSASPGDRVLVHAGTYPGGGWIERQGTSTAWIQVISVDGPLRAVMEGGGETLRVGGGSAYLLFDGLEVRNSGDNAVHIDGRSHHITLRNMYVHDAGPNGDVVKVNQAYDITVENSELARPGLRSGDVNPSQECLDFVDVDRAIIRDNWIHDSASMLFYVKGGSRDAIIERNVFSQQRSGASDPMVGIGAVTDPWLLGGEQYEAINTVFRNNILFGGKTGALAVYDAQNSYIANNLFINNDRVLIEFRAGSGPAGGSQTVRVVNNLFVDMRGTMPTPYMRSSHTLSDFTTSHNLFWNNGNAIPSSSLLSITSPPGHLAANPLVGAPGYYDNRDTIISRTRPGASSPAAGSGMDTSGSPYNVLDDILKMLRNGARDRGPFMLGATSGGTTTTTPTTTRTVSYTASPTTGVVNTATTITARSSGFTSPRYRFWVVTPAGQWTQPCGDYSTNRAARSRRPRRAPGRSPSPSASRPRPRTTTRPPTSSRTPWR